LSEKEVFRCQKEIADILKVSEKTVMFHKSQIMESFNLKRTRIWFCSLSSII